MKIVAPGSSLICNIKRTKKITKDINKQNSKLMILCSIMLVDCLIHSDYQIIQHISQSKGKKYRKNILLFACLYHIFILVFMYDKS